MSHSDDIHAKQSSGANNSVLIMLGALALLGAAGGILYWVSRPPAPIAPPPNATTTAASTTTESAGHTMELPPIDPVSTTTEAPSTSATPAPTVNGVAANYAACPATCSGRVGPELQSALQNKLGLAKHCYQTVINTNEMVSGSMVVRVRVASDGHTCDVGIVNDTTGNGKLQNCVRTQFYGNYPHPLGNCADVPLPLNFQSAH